MNFSKQKITDENGNQLDIENCVSVDNNTEAKFIDFLSQNEVEEFAKDYKN